MDNLPDDIIGEIIYYLPYTIGRSLNKHFNKQVDNIELNNSQSLKADKNLFVKYIKTRPEKIIWSHDTNIHRYQVRDDYIYYRLIDSESYYSYKNDHIDYSSDFINTVIDRFLYDYEKYKVCILYPNFIGWVLSNHPLNYRDNFKFF